MTHTYAQSNHRLAGVGLLGLTLSFGLLTSGDHSVWSAAPGNSGVDPLEILNLSVRANAILVLDSSGSMAQTLLGNNLGADHPGAKLMLAKTVINSVVLANQTRVSFQFGNYSQSVATLSSTGTQVAQAPGSTRFEYAAAFAAPTPAEEPDIQLRLFEVPVGSNWTVGFKKGTTVYTTSAIPPGVYTGTELAERIASLMNAQDSSSYTGTFSDPANANSPAFTFTRGTGSAVFAMRFDVMNSTLRDLLRAVSTETNDVASPFVIQPHVGSFSTAAPATSYVVVGSPTISIKRGSTDYTSTLTAGSYTGSALATHISNQMDTADPSSSSVANYGGAYDSTTGVFTFDRSGSSTENFGINWASWTAALRTLIGATSTNALDNSSPWILAAGSTTVSTGPANSTAPLVLYRRSDDSAYETNELASGGNTYYRAFANKFFNGQTLTVLADGTPCHLTAGTATSSPQITIQTKGSCSGTVTDTTVFLAAGTRSNGSGGGWSFPSSSANCQGFASQVPLAPCTQNEQLSAMAPHLGRELSAPGGVLPGYSESATGAMLDLDGNGTLDHPTVTGIRAGGNTPMAEALIDIQGIFTSTIWPTVNAQLKKQRTFVILLTDGHDTCTAEGVPDNTQSVTTLNENALRAAHKAQVLRQRYVTGQPESSVTTYVVGLGSGVAGIVADRINWIAWGGSGMNNIDASGTVQVGPTLTGTAGATKWSAAPTATQRGNCTTCVDPFLATDAASLTAALQSAIDLGQTAGEFSDQQSITETVYEYVGLAPSPTPIASPSPTAQPSPFHALNPVTRYGTTIPVLLQSTFDMPEFKGHLKAFRSIPNPAYIPTPTPAPSGTPVPVDPNNPQFLSDLLWDAGAKIKTRVVDETNAMGTATYTFAALYGDARTVAVKASTARIKRRIYTTTKQGILSGYTAQNLLSASSSAITALGGPVSGDPTRTQMWPPPDSVAPIANVVGTSADVGTLDAALGLLAPTTVAGVQALIPVACAPTSAAVNHASCTSATAGVPLAQARREAREVILAFMAGAQVSFVNGKPARGTGGVLLFTARPWIMSESTLAAPAVVTPPLIAPTGSYKQAEYLLFRDGPRDANQHALNATANGLGLRNPDLENPQTTASLEDYALKPQMSVIYHATNFGLHAFRAGPCPTTLVSGGLMGSGTLNCSGETGGEELWAFVPFDQLGKLISATKVQSRSNKTYILASPVRITDVFVSGTASTTVSGNTVSVTGVWRTLAVFGRGAGGKSLTAIDVTVPGPFTKHSLETSAPIVVWSRGNFDTSDGKVKVGGNSYVSTSADYDAYLKMGETWSVPAVGFINPITHAGRQVEFALFLGSGYSDSATEGKTFFFLDALSGDVVRSFTLANGTTATTVNGQPLRNVLAASPAIYSVDDSGASPYGFGYLKNPVESKAKYVYFGDLHSRIWRYTVATPDVAPVAIVDVSGDGDQPFSNGLAMLEVGGRPNIWFSSGRDSRVPLRVAAPRFRMYGYEDASLASPPGALTQNFYRDFPENYRGNSAPAAGYTGGDIDNDPATPSVYTPVVFFTALSFVSNGATPETICQSRFDSVLFALKGLSGLAAFDLNSQSTAESDDAFTTVVGQVLQNPHITGEGTVVIDRGLGAQTPPPPPAAPRQQVLPPQSQSTTVVTGGLTPGTPAWNTLKATTVPYRTGTAVCNVTH